MSSVGERPLRPIIMACPECEVTWRGQLGDECWSCGDTGRVRAATPDPVRLAPVASTSGRLAG